MSQVPNSEGGDGSRADKLKESGEAEQSRPTAHEDVKGSSVSCVSGRRASEGSSPPISPSEPPSEDDVKPPPIKPHYYHVGIDFAVRQYGIGKRDMLLKLPMYVPTVKSVGLLQKAAASTLPMLGKNAPADLKKITPPASLTGAPEPFVASLTQGANRLKVEPKVLGYALDGGASNMLNQLLGTAIAVHLQRTGIIKPNGTGNFRGHMLTPAAKGLETTEMLGLNLHAYLRAKVDGAVVIREIIQGKLGAVVSPADYDKRKLAEPKIYSDALCGSMPLIPGVYQVHVLLNDPTTDAEGAGGVSLAEIHCDGDCLFP